MLRSAFLISSLAFDCLIFGFCNAKFNKCSIHSTYNAMQIDHGKEKIRKSASCVVTSGT